MQNKFPVSVIINVYNEGATIEKEILNINEKILQKIPGSELIIAEDGSTDGTKEIISKYVEQLGIVHSTGVERKGYTKALRDAMVLAKNPYIFFSDTGNKFNFDEFGSLYSICEKHAAVIGVRSNRNDQLYRRFLTWFYNYLVRKYFGIDIIDADSGFRIYSNIYMKKIVVEPWINNHLINSELTLRVLFSGGTIGQVPVSYSQRSSVSRGLPPTKIPKVIISVIKNFPALKRTLSSSNYTKIS